MAELIWRVADPKAAGHVATYNSGGARVEVHREPSQSLRDSSPRGGAKGAPGWVTAGLQIMAQRVREYLDETGRLPSETLMADFQREMGKRLDAYIREPMKHPFLPVSLRAFEVGG